MRAFVAVDISGEARETLAEAVEILRAQGITGVRWVRFQGVHLTLKFLGEIDPTLTQDILGAMERAAGASTAFSVRLSNLGAFPRPDAPRVIWAGLDGDMEVLKGLQEDVDREVSPLAGVSMETRPFAPHLTLGRVRDNASSTQRRGLGDAISGFHLASTPSWRVADVHLIRSTLTPDGAVYEVLGSRKLGAGSVAE